MRGPSATSDGSSAPVKEPQFDLVFVGGAMEFAVRFVEFPRAGEHSAILVGVGIAQHHFLPSFPRLDQRPILRMFPQASHHSSGSAKRSDRFEKRDGHQARIVARTPHVYRAMLCQTNDCQHIVFGLRTADDVVPDGAWRVLTLELRNHPKGVKQFPAPHRKAYPCSN